MPKFDKAIISIALALFLILIILIGYLFVRGLFPCQLEKSTPTELKALNIDQNKVIENPTEEDIQNLLDKMKKKNDIFLKNVEENKDSLE